MAVHTIPGYDEAKFKEMAKQSGSKIPQGYNWKLTYCAFGDSKFFCEWDAPSKEALEQAFKQNNMPFDAIYPVKQFNVSSGEYEAEEKAVTSTSR